MQFQKGFIGLGALIAILLAVIVIGGGAYYVMHQNAAPQPPVYQTDNSGTQQATQTSSTQTQPSSNTQEASTNLSATPLSGTPPLRVNFTVPHMASDWEIWFGDGSYNYGSRIAETLPQKNNSNFTNTYSYPGIYTAVLTTSPSNEPLGSVKITVAGSPSVLIESNVSGQNCNMTSPSITQITDKQGNESFAFKDNTHVYGSDVDGNCDTLVGANPTTFVALDKSVGKDASHVWIFGGGTENGNDDAILPTEIVGADPATLTLFSDSNDTWGGGFSYEYIKDKNHVYTLDAQDGKPAGQVVVGADPASFQVSTIQSCGTNCQYDAFDKNNKYLHGVKVQGVAQSQTSTGTGTFSASPTTGTAPLTVTFSNLPVTAAEVDLNFGDGTPEASDGYNGCWPVNGTVPNPCSHPVAGTVTHTYTKSGTYNAVVTGEMSEGQLGQVTITVQ